MRWSPRRSRIAAGESCSMPLETSPQHFFLTAAPRYRGDVVGRRHDEPHISRRRRRIRWGFACWHSESALLSPRLNRALISLRIRACTISSNMQILCQARASALSLHLPFSACARASRKGENDNIAGVVIFHALLRWRHMSRAKRIGSIVLEAMASRIAAMMLSRERFIIAAMPLGCWRQGSKSAATGQAMAMLSPLWRNCRAKPRCYGDARGVKSSQVL